MANFYEQKNDTFPSFSQKRLSLVAKEALFGYTQIARDADFSTIIKSSATMRRGIFFVFESFVMLLAVY